MRVGLLSTAQVFHWDIDHLKNADDHHKVVLKQVLDEGNLSDQKTITLSLDLNLRHKGAFWHIHQL
jgi:hypothetical protein